MGCQPVMTDNQILDQSFNGHNIMIKLKVMPR